MKKQRFRYRVSAAVLASVGIVCGSFWISKKVNCSYAVNSTTNTNRNRTVELEFAKVNLKDNENIYLNSELKAQNHLSNADENKLLAEFDEAEKNSSAKLSVQEISVNVKSVKKAKNDENATASKEEENIKVSKKENKQNKENKESKKNKENKENNKEKLGTTVAKLNVNKNSEVIIPRVNTKVEVKLKKNFSGWVTTPLNVRSGASLFNSVIGVLKKGTYVEGQESDGWIEIKFKDKKAYVNKNYISTEKVNTKAEENAKKENKKKSETINNIVIEAKSLIGSRYVYASSNPKIGFDCSGFTSYLYRNNAGINLDRSSTGQANDGQQVKGDLEVGDILLFKSDNSSRISHVGLYIGGNKFIHASTESTGVIETSLESGYFNRNYVGARRILN